MDNARKAWDDHVINYNYDLAVVIGRFQPFHNGHLALINEAKKVAKRTLILIGSSHIARNIKNPFTYMERVEMIRSACDDFNKEHQDDGLLFGSLKDDLYSDQEWIASVQSAVNSALYVAKVEGGSVVLVGHHKDDSSYYLDMFPAFKSHEVAPAHTMHSTTIRDVMFGMKMIPADTMPQEVEKFVKGWMGGPNYKEPFFSLCEEYNFIEEYKTQWVNAPFVPIFSTTDAVVLCQGHVLLVKRRANPGKGLWALPGGFLAPDESIQTSMLRELDEETRIKIPKSLLEAYIKDRRVFDHPDRSLRGRTITTAFLIVLPDKKLPKVRGSDDAEKAKWFPLSKFYGMTDVMYEDHHSIVSYMINRA